MRMYKHKYCAYKHTHLFIDMYVDIHIHIDVCFVPVCKNWKTWLTSVPLIPIQCHSIHSFPSPPRVKEAPCTFSIFTYWVNPLSTLPISASTPPCRPLLTCSEALLWAVLAPAWTPFSRHPTCQWREWLPRHEWELHPWSTSLQIAPKIENFAPLTVQICF